MMKLLQIFISFRLPKSNLLMIIELNFSDSSYNTIQYFIWIILSIFKNRKSKNLYQNFAIWTLFKANSLATHSFTAELNECSVLPYGTIVNGVEKKCARLACTSNEWPKFDRPTIKEMNSIITERIHSSFTWGQFPAQMTNPQEASRNVFIRGEIFVII